MNLLGRLDSHWSWRKDFSVCRLEPSYWLWRICRFQVIKFILNYWFFIIFMFLHIRTTFVQSFNTYWIAVKGTPVKVKRALSDSTGKVEETTAVPTTTTTKKPATTKAPTDPAGHVSDNSVSDFHFTYKMFPFLIFYINGFSLIFASLSRLQFLTRLRQLLHRLQVWLSIA